MLSSPRSPDSTMRIFSSAENWRRVARRISLMTCSAGAFTGSDCCPIFAPLLATMDYQPSLPQPAASVLQAVTPDSRKFVEQSTDEIAATRDDGLVAVSGHLLGNRGERNGADRCRP